MLNRLKKLLFKSNQQASDVGWDMTHPYSSTEVSRRIAEADIVKCQLAEFMAQQAGVRKFVSLGENCSSAWYLKQVGLKQASYPFDWIFSSPEIVLDCINDKFEKFLDKDLIEAKPGNTSAGHLYYHDNLFNHRNPLASEEDYSYLKRCCTRFIELLESRDHACFLITLINEPWKRTGWAKGFVRHFPMPENQNLETVLPLIESLRDKNDNSTFLIIDHYTSSVQSTVSRKISEDIFFIEYHADGNSTGVFYETKLDDFCFKQILTGLYGIHKTNNK